MFPVFSLVLDKDVKSEVAMLYPELYKDLLKVFSDGSHAGFQFWMRRDDCDDFMSHFFLLTGSTSVFQDIFNMGLNKYLSR